MLADRRETRETKVYPQNPIRSKEISHNPFVYMTLPLTAMNARAGARSCNKAFVFRNAKRRRVLQPPPGPAAGFARGSPLATGRWRMAIGCYNPARFLGGVSVCKARLIAVLGFATLLMGQDQDFSKVQIKVTKVSGNIYMLQGSGGNIAASVGEDGIVIVD